jgi:hypothetical protein
MKITGRSLDTQYSSPALARKRGQNSARVGTLCSLEKHWRLK